MGRGETGFEGTDFHQLKQKLGFECNSEVHRNCRTTSSCHTAALTRPGPVLCSGLPGPDCSGHCLGQAGWLFPQETPCSEVSHLMNKDAPAIYSPFTLIFHFLQLLLFKHALLWSPLLICLATFVFFLLSKSVKDIKEGVMRK